MIVVEHVRAAMSDCGNEMKTARTQIYPADDVRSSGDSSVSEISSDKLRSARDSLICSGKRSFYPSKQSRNRSIPTLASK